MAFPQTAPIGASMVHLLGGGAPSNPPSIALESSSASSSEATLATTQGVNRTSITPKNNASCSLPTMPCLLLPWALLEDPVLPAASPNNNNNNNNNSRRILLQGPSQSGRTSLAMNLAYACAAAGVENATTLPPCHCLLQSCRCTNVVLYRKVSPRLSGAPSSSASENFPLPCVYCSGDLPRPHDLRVRGETDHHRPKSNTSAGAASTMNAPEEDEHKILWDPNILRRIRVQYVSSARDILQDLLGLLGKPMHEHPTRAIIIDDLDQICAGDVVPPGVQQDSSSSSSSSRIIWRESADNNKGRSNNNAASETAISIMQTLAVTVDTSHALQRLHGELPFVLASASSRTKIVAPWMDTVVTLGSSSPSSSTATAGGAAPVTAHQNSSSCCWRADFRGTCSAGGGGSTAWSATVDYSTTNHPLDGTPRIEWNKRR